MKRNDKNVIATANVLCYEHPVFWKLEEDKNNPDVLEGAIRYFKEHGIPVDKITLPGRPAQYYAIWNADTEEEAREANRNLERYEKAFFRRVMPMMQRETSLNALQEKGYDPDSISDVCVDAKRRNHVAMGDAGKKDFVFGYEPPRSREYSDPADIHEEATLLSELAKALTEVTDEQCRICNAVKEGKTDRDMAAEMGMAKSTYQDRKAKTLKAVGDKLKTWK